MPPVLGFKVGLDDWQFTTSPETSLVLSKWDNYRLEEWPYNFYV